MGCGVILAKIIVKNKWFLGFALATIVALGQISPPAHATDTGVNVYVDAPQLAVTNVPSSHVMVTSTPFLLRGRVYKLNQIRLYIDGQFATVIPLDQSATTFEYDINVSPGQHAIKLIGIGNDGPIPAVSFTIDYQPSVVLPPTTPPGTNSQPTQTGNGVFIGPGLQKSTAGVTPFSAVPGIGTLYSGLVFLDIIHPGGSMSVGVPRLVLLLVAVVLLIFSPLVIAMYRRVRYKWLGWHQRPLPAVVRRHPLAFLRVVGLILLIVVICWV